MYIYEAIGITALAIIYTTYGINPFKFKPFNCSKCIAFWFGLTYHLAFINVEPLAILTASLSSVLTIIYFKWITS
jgi:hypothetical protein